jgi:hypothetical protein
VGVAASAMVECECFEPLTCRGRAIGDVSEERLMVGDELEHGLFTRSVLEALRDTHRLAFYVLAFYVQ